MATVHWPGEEVQTIRRFASLQRIPFLLDDNEDYPDGVNAYVYERVRGAQPARHAADRRLVPRPLAKQTARQLAYNLADLLTWAATPAAHPDLGAIGWRELKSWHITELYQDALRLGFWSENYWTTRQPAPLAPATVRARVGEGLGC